MQIKKNKNLSKLALGTAQFGQQYGILNKTGKVAFDEVGAILNEARSINIGVLDTAFVYGNCEEVLGDFGVNGFDIVTKIPSLSHIVYDELAGVEEYIKLTLKRLKTTKLYGVLFHSSSDLLGQHGKELFTALQEVKDRGMISKLGVSIYDPSELDELAVAEVDVDIVQAPFNVFDRRLETSGWLRKLKQNKVEIHLRSIFLQGILLTEAPNMPRYFAKWNDHFQRWENWLSKNRLNKLQACVNFVHSQSDADKIIIGVDSLQHLKKLSLSFLNASDRIPQSDLMIDEIELIDPRNWK